jgi:hypothetical protein
VHTLSANTWRQVQVTLQMNPITYIKTFHNEIKPLHVSANGGHEEKAANTGTEILHVYYMYVLSCQG